MVLELLIVFAVIIILASWIAELVENASEATEDVKSMKHNKEVRDASTHNHKTIRRH